jgi:putative exporter of polyketide antibiotics
MVSWLKDWQWLSLLYYFNPKQIFHDGINWWHVLVLCSLIVVFYLVGTIGFRGRDVNGG